MKVRDLRQYIKSISKGNETLELVGSNKEYFLNMMSGQGQKVDALITGAASFANNAKEQLFYELRMMQVQILYSSMLMKSS